MRYSGVNYYIYKILNGIDFDVRVCPDRDYEKRLRKYTNKNSDDAGVCLNCRMEKCSGSTECYERERQKQIDEKKKSAKNRTDGKEVVD